MTDTGTMCETDPGLRVIYAAGRAGPQTSDQRRCQAGIYEAIKFMSGFSDMGALNQEVSLMISGHLVHPRLQAFGGTLQDASPTLWLEQVGELLQVGTANVSLEENRQLLKRPLSHNKADELAEVAYIPHVQGLAAAGLMLHSFERPNSGFKKWLNKAFPYAYLHRLALAEREVQQPHALNARGFGVFASELDSIQLHKLSERGRRLAVSLASCVAEWPAS